MNSASNGFLRPFWSNGPSPGNFYHFAGGNYRTAECKEFGPQGTFGSQRGSQPITTGTSVIGVKFDGGVMIAADNLVSYGSLARFQDVQRVFKVNDQTIMGAGGEYADFQSVKRFIDQKTVDDICHDDGIDLKPKSLYNWLTRLLYNKRSQFAPLWLDMVIGGLENGEPFLGHIDCRGRAYQDSVVATGFGKHLALPLIRERIGDKKILTQQEASDVLRKAMEVLYYRDCRALSKYHVAICTAGKTTVEGPISVSQNWNLATMVKGY